MDTKNICEVDLLTNMTASTNAVVDESGRLSRVNLIDAIYPIGSIYMSISNTSPSVLFGGTWEQIKDRFLLSAGDSYEAGSTGGKTSYTLSANIGAVNSNTSSLGYVAGSPTEYQRGNYPTFVVYGASATGGESIGWNHSTAVTEQGVNNRNVTIEPPYLTVYMWKRTS